MMKIAYSKAALKTLKRMPANRRDTIRAKIKQLAENPASLANNLKPLKGTPASRLRIGDDRVIFEIENDSLNILVIGPRGGAYK